MQHSIIRQGVFMLTLPLLLLWLFPLPSLHASTLLLEGEIDGLVSISQEHHFAVPAGGLRELVFRYATPTMVWSASAKQRMSGYRVNFTPRPATFDRQMDRFGNEFVVVTWRELKSDATVNGHFDVKLHLSLKEVRSSAAFPLKGVPGRERLFLEATPLVQANDKSIKALAKGLTEGATSEQEAVTAVLNWVVDKIRYKTSIPNYDALWTLRTRAGNSQNFSHLSIAILRAVGIPARIVGGIVLGKPWKVPLKNGTLVQSTGQGRHAWLEVYYPDLGWVPYDALQSHLFVSPRHIKQTVGLDSQDISDSWRGTPVLPQSREKFTVNYRTDDIKLVSQEAQESPDSYILTSGTVPHVSVETPLGEPPAGKVVPQEDGRVIEFGNMEFLVLVQLSTGREEDDVGYQTFDRETAERETSKQSYAQAFRVERALELRKVFLALGRFKGAAGSLWIDVVKDREGRPGMEVVRSIPMNIDNVEHTPGYSWFPFIFSRSGNDYPLLPPGRYWIILRRSNVGVVNWFYTPANPYGDADDTRSTSQGADRRAEWSNILNYDFNFRVTGRYR